MKHTSYVYDFDTLYLNLEEKVDKGLVDRSGHDKYPNLKLYTYSRQCQYDKLWDDFTLAARGLILDIDARKVIACGFHKFFNYGEFPDSLPNFPFTVTTKVDGSFGICFFYDNQWHIATKGSFHSDQAVWATNFLRNNLPALDPSITYLFEIIYKDNRIVVNYKGWEGLILLGAYQNGIELDIYDNNFPFSAFDGDKYKKVDRHKFESIDQIVDLCETIDKDQEGFVVRFENGFRIKIKGKDYLRIHKLISSISPIAIWESMMARDNIDLIRKELPEEFLAEYNAIYNSLNNEVTNTTNELVRWLSSTGQKELKKSRKDYALAVINQFGNSPIKTLAFYYADHKDNDLDQVSKNLRALALKSLRPNGNKLKNNQD